MEAAANEIVSRLVQLSMIGEHEMQPKHGSETLCHAREDICARNLFSKINGILEEVLRTSCGLIRAEMWPL